MGFRGSELGEWWRDDEYVHKSMLKEAFDRMKMSRFKSALGNRGWLRSPKF